MPVASTGFADFQFFTNIMSKNFQPAKELVISPMNKYNEVVGEPMATPEKLKQDNAVLYEALRLAAFSVADESDPLGTTRMHGWIEQAKKNLN